MVVAALGPAQLDFLAETNERAVGLEEQAPVPDVLVLDLAAVGDALVFFRLVNVRMMGALTILVGLATGDLNLTALTGFLSAPASSSRTRAMILSRLAINKSPIGSGQRTAGSKSNAALTSST